MHAFITIAIPFASSHTKDVTEALDRLGNPLLETVRDALDQTGIIHFMSGSVVRAATERAYLIWEISGDGCRDAVLSELYKSIGDRIAETLAAAGIAISPTDLLPYLARHCHDVGTGWFSTPGLVFTGTPGMTVARIRAEAALANRIRHLLETMPHKGSALQTLERVRAALEPETELSWSLSAEPAAILNGPRGTVIGALPFLGLSAFTSFLWPAAVPFIIVFVLAVAWGWHENGLGMAAVAATTVLIIACFLSLGLVAYLYRRFRAAECADVPDDSNPSSLHVSDIMRRENYTAQNHLAAVSAMKHGWLRRFTLRIAFCLIGFFVVHVFRPGKLAGIGTIHFARWMLLPGSDKLLFFSNYDGSWEAYLEDFIEQAHAGLTAIWSNTAGFPRTKNLFQNGAIDGDRFKRWARRQQSPTRFWYSAYPTLTTTRIRTNAAIRQGVAAATFETEAADWLACFGSAQSPATYVETTNIQTLAFGGLSRLAHATCILGSLSGDVIRGRRWASEIAPSITFGPAKLAKEAHLMAFTSSGLLRLGLKCNHLSTFPVAFQQGMVAPWRSRLLGDSGKNDPSRWVWGGSEMAVDFALLVYARSAEDLTRLVTAECRRILDHGHKLVTTICMAELPPPGKPSPEPFGFEDGLSQPVIRGLRPRSKGDDDHVVEPGEFILGYADNRGFTPPSPRVTSIDDPECILPCMTTDPCRERPNFADLQPNLDRDFGRNGTFLVIRQMEQDIGAFNDAISRAVNAIKQQANLPIARHLIDDWLAAKMVGRWKNGNSLVRHPTEPGSPIEDNDFKYGKEDPGGVLCPIGAHIRRANPRDSFNPGVEEQVAIINRHRILRIGRPYRPADEGQDPGLLFMCLNGDIERQFEFVQQGWISNPNFLGLENEQDPLLARGERATGLVSIPMPSGPLNVRGMKDFVTVIGGGYFFMPGRQALDFLAAPALSKGAGQHDGRYQVA